MNTSLSELIKNFPRPGRLEWISIRPVRREPVQVVAEIEVSADKGLVGDHYSGRSGNRHITLLQAEHLPAIAALAGLPEVDPGLLRRNLIVSGINLLALKNQRFRIGPDVMLEATGDCHPCSRMETNLGPGGYNAMRGHGGITARVIQGGIIRVGDEVVVV